MNKYKILGILDSGGSKKIRIQVILEALKGKKVNINGEEREIEVSFLTFPIGKIELIEDMVKGYDLIYNNWLVNTHVTELSLWRSKYLFKYILDLDDCYDDNSHPYYNPSWEGNIIRTAIFADFITTTNPYLASKLEGYNKNIAIIPNFMPVGEFQYIGKSEDKKYNKDRKMSVALFGSYSHYLDFQLFKPILNRLAKNKNIVENCEFTLAGVNNPDIINIFKKKKNIALKILPPKPIDSYMELLDEVDIVCQPLTKTPHNIAKSGLKILESSIKDCILLGSELYETKEFNAYFKCETPLDYERTIEFLLKDNNYTEFQQKLCKENLEVNKWQQRVDFTIELIEKVSILEDRKLEDVELYGITYADNQFTEYNRYDNSHVRTVEDRSYLFEYNSLIDLSKSFENNKYYGIFSWKFGNKTMMDKNLLYALLEEQKYQDYDVLGLCHQLPIPYLEFSEKQHPGFKDLFTLLCQDLNLEVKEPKNVVYSNHFIAKGNVYRDFIDGIIKPAIELMETKYKGFVWKDANYQSGLSPEKLKEVTGLDFYTFHTFLLERLLSVWLENRNDLKFKQVI